MLSSEVSSNRFFISSLGAFYRCFAQPLSWVALRVLVGGALIIEGWPKVLSPMGQVGFVEGIGFHPGWFWSPLLAGLQVVGGLLIAIGLFTRPAALACGVMLAITYWFHVTHPYGAAFLTQAGIDALKADANPALFTSAATARLMDGGASFLAQVQGKAQNLSAIWTLAVLFFAGHGGGPLSADRSLIGREF